VTFTQCWGSTVYHITDLPFKPHLKFEDFPDWYRVEAKNVSVRNILASPEQGDLPFPKELSSTERKAVKFMPDLVKHFYFTKEEVISELKLHYFPGGETKALDVLKLYLSSNRISKHGRMRGNTF